MGATNGITSAKALPKALQEPKKGLPDRKR